MTDVAYRVFQTGPDFKVEIIRPGEVTQVTLGFATRAAAEAWVEQDRHIDGLDEQRQSGPVPHLRVVQ